MDAQTIGGYRIVGELGRGGMGIVYHAMDTKIGRPVAVKVIRIDPNSPSEIGAQLRERLAREASAAGKMSHPGIVTIYQLGEEGADVFVAMEFIKGTSLEAAIAGGPLPLATALDLLRQIADALDYAHRFGVVHRDVKPANILINEDGRIKVADFGIAKVIQSATKGLTATGMSLGSPSYMSPEQVQALQIDGRSDQFSLAIVGWKMLTGELPFSAESPHAVMYLIVSGEPNTGQSMRPALAQVFARALAKDPAQRFASCVEFVETLAQAASLPGAATSRPEPPRMPPPAPAPVATQQRTSPTVAPVPVEPPSAPVPQARSAPTAMILVAVMLVGLLGLGGWWWKSRSGAAESSTPSDGRSSSDGKSSRPVTGKGSPLIKAMNDGRMDEAKGLIAAGKYINDADENGNTPLMIAADGSPYFPDNAPIVESLLNAKATVDAQDSRGRTALYRAAGEGKADAVRLLLAREANPNQKAADGSTVLLEAALFGRVPVVKLLLDAGAKLATPNAQGDTALMIAAEGGPYLPDNAPFVEYLIGKGAALEAKDSRGRTALFRAATAGKEEAVRVLTEHKADVNARDMNGATPLMEAVMFGKEPVMKYLLQHGGEVNRPDSQGNTALMIAAEGGPYLPDNEPYVRALIAAGATVDARDQRGRTPLFRAAEGGRVEAIQALVEKKANVNAKTTEGVTPLLVASTYGKIDAVKLLLKSGAQPNLADANGTTPLMAASEKSSYITDPDTLVKLLLGGGANADLKDQRGRTALARATETSNDPVIALLKKGR